MAISTDKQELYEITRRTRTIGLGMDQCLHGMKSIIAFTDPKFWPNEDRLRWGEIRYAAENMLIMMMELERNLSIMAPIYQSFVPVSIEATTTPIEMQVPDENSAKDTH